MVQASFPAGGAGAWTGADEVLEGALADAGTLAGWVDWGAVAGADCEVPLPDEPAAGEAGDELPHADRATTSAIPPETHHVRQFVTIFMRPMESSLGTGLYGQEQ